MPWAPTIDLAVFRVLFKPRRRTAMMMRNLCSKRLWLELGIVVGFLSVMGFPARIYAQVAGATLTGTVKDSSLAIIPNAQVAIADVATG